MAMKNKGFRDKKKLYSGIMCLILGLFFFVMIHTHGFTVSKVIFGGLLLYFGIANLRLAR